MQIYTTISTKGGVGKSQIAWHLAGYHHELGERVLILDLDHPDQFTQHHYASIARDLDKPHPRVVRVRPSTNLRKTKKAMLDVMAREPVDVVVIDTPGRAGDEMRLALSLAHIALIASGDGTEDLVRTVATWELARSYVEARDDLYVTAVLSRVDKRSRYTRSARRNLDRVGVPLLKSRVRRLTDFRDAVAAGLSVTAWDPHSEGARDLRKVIAELARAIQKEIADAA